MIADLLLDRGGKRNPCKLREWAWEAVGTTLVTHCLTLQYFQIKDG
jgi:hypothetical protein